MCDTRRKEFCYIFTSISTFSIAHHHWEGRFLHHQKAAALSTLTATIFYHIQLRLIVELTLNIDIIFLSKYFRNKWRRIDSLSCRRGHYERARIIGGARDAWVLLKGMMVQVCDVMRWWSGRQLNWRWWCRLTAESRCLVAIDIILDLLIIIFTGSWWGAVDVMQLTHVFLQVEVTTEAFWADLALWMRKKSVRFLKI